MNLPIRPAGQTAPEPQTNPWKVLALVFGGILVYEGVSYYWNRERGRYVRRNPAKTFRIVENGVYLGTFAGETYAQARFSASQYYWTNEYVTLAEKAREVEAKRARKNPAKRKKMKPETRTMEAFGYRFDVSPRVKIHRETIDTKRPGDYGADPIGDGTFRMVPSGDIVSFEERNRRLKR